MSSRFPTLDIYFFCLSIYKQTRHVLVFTWSLGLADAVHSPVNKKEKKKKRRFQYAVFSSMSGQLILRTKIEFLNEFPKMLQKY